MPIKSLSECAFNSFPTLSIPPHSLGISHRIQSSPDKFVWIKQAEIYALHTDQKDKSFLEGVLVGLGWVEEEVEKKKCSDNKGTSWFET